MYKNIYFFQQIVAFVSLDTNHPVDHNKFLVPFNNSCFGTILVLTFSEIRRVKKTKFLIKITCFIYGNNFSGSHFIMLAIDLKSSISYLTAPGSYYTYFFLRFIILPRKITYDIENGWGFFLCGYRLEII